MNDFFRKNKTQYLVNKYDEKLCEAMKAKRMGDVRSYSILNEEADEIYQKIKILMQQKTA